MQTWVKIAAAAGLLLLAGLFYYLRLDSFPNDIGSRRDYKANLMCRACGHSYLAKLDTDDSTYPQKCEKCAKAEAWPCINAMTAEQNLLPFRKAIRRICPFAVCPKCKSSRVGSVPVKQ